MVGAGNLSSDILWRFRDGRKLLRGVVVRPWRTAQDVMIELTFVYP